MINNIFFDFDGVILESVDVKSRAFQEIYSPYGDHVAQNAVEYHLKHGGLSRYEKFKYCHKELLGKDLTSKELQKLGDQFQELAFDGVTNAPFTLGVKKFLKTFYKKIRFSIISGTPMKELKIICDQLKLMDFFYEIYGSPTGKISWCQHIITTNNLRHDEIVFIGDSMTDYIAAKQSSVHFLLMKTKNNQNQFKDYKGRWIKNFTRTESILEDW